MTLAARKNKSCNNRMGMLSSSLLCVVSIIGSAYCTLISIYALSKGPLICEKGSNTLDSCDYTLGNLSTIQTLTFDLAWFLNDTCIPTPPTDANVTAFLRDGLPNLPNLPNFVPDFEIDERSQKIIHITVFVGLAIVGLLQMIVALSQIVSGFFGCLCGTSKFKRNRHSSSGNVNRGYKYYNE